MLHKLILILKKNESKVYKIHRKVKALSFSYKRGSLTEKIDTEKMRKYTTTATKSLQKI